MQNIDEGEKDAFHIWNFFIYIYIYKKKTNRVNLKPNIWI